ncbi:hypothetical protein DMA12_18305 [Amycolatopsis balhimycina DSM 5908]|uniref:Uncharacterized protein n=1 Tax=Amycolatopsis balhimycina DSM 5908 TaxID=1081091 RepID=A0A428WL96_AMYBA|nr:hypothetical protein [Amycolatopsis balhimycina]RSM43823.1 hypothetical protein DMA12_18305 [Amycolatopsis balhimycina DSM 5908]
MPTPGPDGGWFDARTDLIRPRLCQDRNSFAVNGPLVPGVTSADLALMGGTHQLAADGYRDLLAVAPDVPAALVGLGLALAARGTWPAVRALLHRPELVRAVHRELRSSTDSMPAIEVIAWGFGRFIH